MGMIETIIFGMLALMTAITAIRCLRSKPPIISLLLGVGTILFVCLSGYNWRLALIDSGKNTAWLGFSRYPFALIILVALSAVALISIVMSASSILKRKR